MSGTVFEKGVVVIVNNILHRILIVIGVLVVSYCVIYQILLAEYHIKKWWERKKANTVKK